VRGQVGQSARDRAPRAAAPDTSCRVEVTADGDGNGLNDWAYFCYQGTLNTTGFEYDILATVSVNRIWLHRFANGTKWADCFTGGHSYALSGRDQHPSNIPAVRHGFVVAGPLVRWAFVSTLRRGPAADSAA